MPLILAAALGAAAVQTPAPAPALLAPVLDRPYRLVFEDERVDPSGTRHFRVERTVVFHREPGGLLAVVTLVAVWTDAAGEFGRRFTTATSALKDRPVRFHLSPDGRVSSIDDEPAVWAAVVAGVAAIASTSGRVSEIGRRPELPLAMLPPEAARSTLASILTPMLAGSDAAVAPGSRTVTLPRSTLAPSGSDVPATEVVTRQADGTLRFTVRAGGNDPALERRIDRVRVIDPAHGLVLLAENSQLIAIPGGTHRILSRMRVDLPVR